MAKTPRKSPGVGHNLPDDLPDQSEYRMALAMVVLMDEEKKKMNERHKRLRKRCIEGKSIAQEDVNLMFKMRENSISDITAYLKRKAHSLGAMFGRTFQLDMFSPDPDAAEAIRFKAMLAGVEGLTAVPPATLDNTERNIWMEGHKQGADARAATIKEMSAEFTKGEEGDFSESALTKRAKSKAKAVGLQAAEDFAKDQEAEGIGGPTAEEQNLGNDAKPTSQSDKANAKRTEAGVH